MIHRFLPAIDYRMPVGDTSFMTQPEVWPMQGQRRSINASRRSKKGRVGGGRDGHAC